MNEEKFWKMVSLADKVGIEAVELELTNLGTEEILSFYHLLTKMIAKACSFPLLAANFTIQSYVSDDGFREFRAWLISQGEDRFYRGH